MQAAVLTGTIASDARISKDKEGREFVRFPLVVDRSEPQEYVYDIVSFRKVDLASQPMLTAGAYATVVGEQRAYTTKNTKTGEPMVRIAVRVALLEVETFRPEPKPSPVAARVGTPSPAAKKEPEPASAPKPVPAVKFPAEGEEEDFDAGQEEKDDLPF